MSNANGKCIARHTHPALWELWKRTNESVWRAFESVCGEMNHAKGHQVGEQMRCKYCGLPWPFEKACLFPHLKDDEIGKTLRGQPIDEFRRKDTGGAMYPPEQELAVTLLRDAIEDALLPGKHDETRNRRNDALRFIYSTERFSFFCAGAGVAPQFAREHLWKRLSEDAQDFATGLIEGREAS